MAIKTSELNAKLFGKSNKRRASTPIEAQAAAKDKAQVIELAIAGKALVSFELMSIPLVAPQNTSLAFPAFFVIEFILSRDFRESKLFSIL